MSAIAVVNRDQSNLIDRSIIEFPINITNSEQEKTCTLINSVIQKWLEQYPAISIADFRKKISKISFANTVSSFLYDKRELLIDLSVLYALLERPDNDQKKAVIRTFLNNPNDSNLRSQITQFVEKLPESELNSFQEIFYKEMWEPEFTKSMSLGILAHEFGHVIYEILHPLDLEGKKDKIMLNLLWTSVIFLILLGTWSVFSSFSELTKNSIGFISAGETVIALTAIVEIYQKIDQSIFSDSKQNEQFADTAANNQEYLEGLILYFEKLKEKKSQQLEVVKLEVVRFINTIIKNKRQKYLPDQIADPHGTLSERIERCRKVLSQMTRENSAL